MPSLHHESLLLLFRNQPRLAPRLLSEALQRSLPSCTSARVGRIFSRLSIVRIWWWCWEVMMPRAESEAMAGRLLSATTWEEVIGP